MKKVKWLKRFNSFDPGHIEEVPKEKAKFWRDGGLVEYVKEAKPPKDKMIKGSKTK